MSKSIALFSLFFSILSAFGQELNNSFVIANANELATIVYDESGSSLDSISAYLLAEDIFRIAGKKPVVTGDIQNINGNIIAIGGIKSNLIKGFLKEEGLGSGFQEQKESFLHMTIDHPTSREGKVLVVAGTDPRGTAFGVFELSEKIGVSPWYWWADVPVEKKTEIVLYEPGYFSEEPSVEYRGIFLNDEDWGLQPWAENTFEPEVGDIGPKTYSKIFELLLRLKANTIWPAMHPSTKAFFYYPGNPEMAEKYHIVVGSSHAEPMLRNNVDEWDKDSMGSFNYLANRETIYTYWEDRVKESKNMDAIYSLGIRGIHDSGMEGVKGIEEATVNLQNVLRDQREILEKNSNREVSEIPQAFTVYKEVLDLYDHGLSVPEDVTIMWTDDNYGYIRRLSDEKERARKGGGGVYYHVSYWGRPHDYQWLSTTHPGLIREEMIKAYKTNSRRMWILNVGDIKPAEYNTQLFLDMAYNIEKFEDPESIDDHMKMFYSTAFGKERGAEIADLKMQYYHLAFERKPEFMGWSQTEPTTGIDTTAYDPFTWGDEVNSRIKQYNELEKQVEKIKWQLEDPAQDAYFQLVYYPVKAASFMNKKFLYRDLAVKYSVQKRIKAKDYKNLSHSYYDSIAFLTKKFNEEIAGGKWKGMMDMSPRRLPVFDKPEIPVELNNNTTEVAGIHVENSRHPEEFKLPTFYKNSSKSHFIDLYLKKSATVSWSVEKIPAWLIVSKTRGSLKDGITSEERLMVSIDWKNWRKAKQPQQAEFVVQTGKQRNNIQLKIQPSNLPETAKNIFTEQNGVVSIYAENFSDKRDQGGFKWEKLPELGHSYNLMKTVPVIAKPLDTLQIQETSPYLEYTIHTESINKNGELILHTLPTHPLTNEHSLRVGVQWNNNPVQIMDFRTYGRSEEWKQNVLKNLAQQSIPVELAAAGEQTLRIYMIDEGVYLDFIYLTLKNIKFPYSLLPETRIKKSY